MGKRSYSLIELLIVIIVVGIIVAIGAVICYQRVVISAELAQVKHAISLLAQAERIYFDEHGQYLAINSSDPGAAIDTLKEATGIDLRPILSLTVKWEFSMGGAIIKAAGRSGQRVSNYVVEYNCDTGTWTITRPQ